ncbi:MAG: hypothetical protein IIB60_03900 [Planctomycetes bacterium]|nr:hypothetical protein [Planctomycetota bacterium]
MALHDRTTWLMGLLVVVFCGSAAALGQEGSTDSVAPSGFEPTSATIERIMDVAVGNIARRYNLNETQTQYTGELMRREVRRFLIEHEAEIWPAIRGILATQMGINPPDDPEEVKRLGAAARPLAKLAEETIFRANAEWREVLTDEQKKMHDFDLAAMRQTFVHVDESLASWEEGKPTDAGIFPPAPSPVGGPPVPPKPRTTSTTVIPTDQIPVGILATFVEEFIKDYRLDEGQITSARSILTEFKAKAETFKNTNKEAFAKIVKERSKAQTKRDTKAIKEVTARHKRMLQPFYALFAEMEGRLKGLLTTAQKEQYAERNQAKSRRAKETKPDAKDSTKDAKPQKPKPQGAKSDRAKPDKGKSKEAPTPQSEKPKKKGQKD